MIKRISLEEKRDIARAVYAKYGYHVEHWYPYTAVPIRPARIRIGALDAARVRVKADAAIAKAERLNGYNRKRRRPEGGPR